VNGNELVFGIAAVIAVLSALGVVVSRSAVRSALCLVVTFFCLAVLYFTLQGEMLGVIQIAVYAGAIMVLFLFVIMLLDSGGGQGGEEGTDWKRYWGLAAGVALAMIILAYVLSPLQGETRPFAPEGYGSPHAIGRALFSTYTWPFETVSVLLMLGVVGSVLLAKRRLP